MKYPLIMLWAAFKAQARNQLRAAMTMLGAVIGVSIVISLVAAGTRATATIERKSCDRCAVFRHGYGMASVNEPVVPWYVACTTMSPDSMAVTIPVEEMVARALLDDCQVADEVTSCVVPSDSVATAASCDVAPTAGADPLTLTADTALGLNESPHAVARTAKPTPMTNAYLDSAVAPIP